MTPENTLVWEKASQSLDPIPDSPIPPPMSLAPPKATTQCWAQRKQDLVRQHIGSLCGTAGLQQPLCYATTILAGFYSPKLGVFSAQLWNPGLGFGVGLGRPAAYRRPWRSLPIKKCRSPSSTSALPAALRCFLLYFSGSRTSIRPV